jgi:nucleoid-associated protein YgaU
MSVNQAQAMSALRGLGGSGGELQKLTVYYEKNGLLAQESIQALFNPSEIGLTKSANWEQKHPLGQGGQGTTSVELEFLSVEADRLSIELFFDTYESRPGTVTAAGVAASFLPGGPSPGGTATDVRYYTAQIAALLEEDADMHHPPVCNLRWGVVDIFDGVLVSLNQRFTLFLDDGTPVRATLTCEFVGVDLQPTELHSSDVVKTRQVRRYDTLQSLAAGEYGDPALWRPIALANGIINPRDLAPGTILTIPKLQP